MKASLIDVGNIVGGVIIFIGVVVLVVALRRFFFRLLVLIEYFLTGRRTTGSMSGMADLAVTLARKWDIGRLIRSGIGCVPFGEGVVERRKLIMSVHGKAHVSLDSLNVPMIVIYFRSNVLAHTEDATEGSLDE